MFMWGTIACAARGDNCDFAQVMPDDLLSAKVFGKRRKDGVWSGKQEVL
jgi:hypothetical protein